MLSSSLFAAASALQALEARNVSHLGARYARASLSTLARRRTWLVGGAASVVGWGLEAVALSLASVALVQPALGLGLIVLLVLGVRVLHERIGPARGRRRRRRRSPTGPIRLVEDAHAQDEQDDQPEAERGLDERDGRERERHRFEPPTEGARRAADEPGAPPGERRKEVGAQRARTCETCLASSAWSADAAAKSDERHASRARLRRVWRTSADYDRRVVAIALLTLVPGRLGGSETYVQSLLEALGADRLPSTTACSCLRLPPISTTGLRSEVATEYPPARIAARAVRCDGAGGPLERARRPARRGRRRPLSAHDPATAGRQAAVVTVHDLQHLDLPRMFS